MSEKSDLSEPLRESLAEAEAIEEYFRAKCALYRIGYGGTVWPLGARDECHIHRCPICYVELVPGMYQGFLLCPQHGEWKFRARFFSMPCVSVDTRTGKSSWEISQSISVMVPYRPRNRPR